MREIKCDITEDVLEFIKNVSANTTGYKVYLGGGYLRDKYCGLEPKDVDLFFVPIDNVDKYVPTIPRTFINYRRTSEEIKHMGDRGVDFVQGMFIPHLSTKDVQFIVYKKSMSGEELAEDMDMNINQIMYDIAEDSFICSKDFLEGHEQKTILCLHKFDKERMYKRYVRMETKFPEYSSTGKPELEDKELVEAIVIGVRTGSSSGSSGTCSFADS